MKKCRTLPVLVFFSLVSTFLFGQITQLQLEPGAGCRYDGAAPASGSVFAYEGSGEAKEVVSNILRQVGLPQNFTIKAANVGNAQAFVKGGERYILYSQQFMHDIQNRTGDYWGKVSVLAHEIGHHLLGHTLLGEGSRPALELEADRWAGFVLFKLGATLDQAQAAVNAIVKDSGSATHPPRDERLEFIAIGYQEAKEMNGGVAAAPLSSTAARTYAAVRINGLDWMTQNLDHEVEGSWCYDNDPANCRKYGRLYTWEAAVNACREIGWRLPTDEEWRQLAMLYGGYENTWMPLGDVGDPVRAYQALKFGGPSGLHLQQGGQGHNNGPGDQRFSFIGKLGSYWTSSDLGQPAAIYYSMAQSYRQSIQRANTNGQWLLFSCRCVRD